MGTFHRDKGELHGMTVVVETDGPELWVGRCDDIVAAGVILHDADVHRDGESATSRAAYLARAAEIGVWARHAHVVVPAARVRSVRRLSQY